eukprot:6021179-Prymnesium_polylepis.1
MAGLLTGVAEGELQLLGGRSSVVDLLDRKLAHGELPYGGVVPALHRAREQRPQRLLSCLFALPSSARRVLS